MLQVKFIKPITIWAKKNGSVNHLGQPMKEKKLRALYEVLGTDDELAAYVSAQTKPSFIDGDETRPAFYANKRALSPIVPLGLSSEGKYFLQDDLADNIALTISGLDTTAGGAFASQIGAAILSQLQAQSQPKQPEPQEQKQP